MRFAKIACVIALFSTGVAAFEPEHLNQLTGTNACFNCDLSGVDLSGAALQGAELTLANLKARNLKTPT